MRYTDQLLESLEKEALIRIIKNQHNDISDMEIEQELYKENIKDLSQTIECLRLISKANVKSQNFNN